MIILKKDTYCTNKQATELFALEKVLNISAVQIIFLCIFYRFKRACDVKIW